MDAAALAGVENDASSDKESKKSDAGSYKSSSSELKYQSSSAESLGRADSDKSHKSPSSRSLSRSKSRSRSRSGSRPRSSSRLRSFGGRFERRPPAIIVKDHRRRPFGKFRRDFAPARRDFSDKFNSRFNTYQSNRHSGRTFNSPPRGNDHFESKRRFPSSESSERNYASSKHSPREDSSVHSNENLKVLKPSDLKDNAKQSTQSFLAMLEEKKKTLPFQLNVVQPLETKKIPVKIHGFGKASEKALKEKKQILSLYSSDEFESSATDFNKSKRKKSGKSSHNSTKEEGEIRSDLDDCDDDNYPDQKVKKKIKKSKKAASSDLESSDSDSSAKKKSKKSAKSKRKKKRKHSSSSDSSSSSSSSSSSDSSDSSDSDSSDSSSSSSSSSSSDSSDYKKKKSRRKKGRKRNKKKKDSKEKKAKRSKKVKAKLDTEKLSELVKTEIVENSTANAEWPSDMYFSTKTEPSIQYCINPKYATDEYRDDLIVYLQMALDQSANGAALKSEYDKMIGELELPSSSSKKRSSKENINSRRHTNGDSMSESSFENKSKTLPFIGKMKGLNKKNRLKSRNEPMKLDMNIDYNYYYQYYYSTGYPFMEANDQDSAASIYAYYQMMNSYDYSQQQLSDWVKQRGLNLTETNKYDEVAVITPDDIKKEKDNDTSVKQSSSIVKCEGENDEKEHGETKQPEEKCDPNVRRIEVVTTNHTSSSVSSDYVKFDSRHKLSNGLDDKSELNVSPLSPPPPRPRMTFLESTEPITLMNGVTLPPGTKQIIVHPYNRPVY